MRWTYLDNLKVVLIAGVIALHGLLSYSPLEVWPYALVRETTLAEPSHVAALAAAGPFAIFLMALLFLVAGLLTPGALRCKGVRRFVRDRLLRLGVPFLVFVALVWPVLLYALYRPLGHVSGSFWTETRLNVPDTGPAWFIGVLLVLSLLYAAWAALRAHRAWARRRRRPVTAGSLALLATAVAAASFVVRLWIPYASEAPLDLNEWQWPECAGLFGLGVVAAGQGWLEVVPRPLARRAGQVTGAAVLGAAAYVGLAGPLGMDFAALTGGLRWESAVFVVLEGVLTVFGSVWLLALAQRRLARPRPRGTELARWSYPAFLVQGLPLLALAVALRPVPAPAEVKALVVAAGGVASSFALAALLVRAPGVRQVV
ncbi:acyltransferase [Knoellia sp. 3-2P3]|uniref:acyltransferase n=1 Tax=unclassified Knoellia TaxID=2618719 RepID=UPI0023DAC195|nr:acyltransferase [Knoellia sp. 3-2P3]MDF2093480.1 acyltransferase [Knoellia sp. 3-2P3]